MTLTSNEFPENREILAKTFRGIRQKRSLKSSVVAQRMGLPQRSYELFEAGGGRISHRRIVDFATATDADPFAIILAPSFGSADFAIDCADTKLVLIMIMHLEGFYQDRGGDITYLDPPNIIGAFERVFKELGAKLDDNEAYLERRLEKRTGSIDLGTLSLRGLRRRKA
jgi:hypothetical protein